MTSSYDFIIVGGGTSGCLLAHRLATSAAQPSVLVLEAGIQPSGPYLREPFYRFSTFTLRPDLNYGYVTEPEPELNNRPIAYARGRGLGGSSVINFGVYLYGSGEDYERWADLVGDEAWRWERVKSQLAEIEKYHDEGSASYRHLADPRPSGHGEEGCLRVGLPPVLEKGVAMQMEGLLAAGEKLNLDPNSGDPVGISIFASSYARKGRTTSADAYLRHRPSNLEVWTEAVVEKLDMEEMRVVGVRTSDGRQARASKDVILCAGAIDTPKLLLLNGIGPKDELEKVGIRVQKDLPGVGRNLQDHVLANMAVEVDGSVNDRYQFETDEARLAEAAERWAKDQRGGFALYRSVLWGGFLKLPGLADMAEYQALPVEEQEFLSRGRVPTYELLSNGLLLPGDPQPAAGNSYVAVVAILMNPQSRGSVTLRSAQASDKPVLRLNYLTHAYDRRVMREAIRASWEKIVLNPALAPLVVGRLAGPESLTDGDIDAFMAARSSTVWHANGTVKMGRSDDGEACVDKEFRVFGVDGLRVVDMSVAPMTTNNHTQATAYLIGQQAADKLIRQYCLAVAVAPGCGGG